MKKPADMFFCALVLAAVFASSTHAAPPKPRRFKAVPAEPKQSVPSDSGFGSSVAVSDKHVVVGAPYAHVGAPYSGIVKVFDVKSGELRFVLPNPVPMEQSQFGISLAISGDKLVIGARKPGAAYVYDLSGQSPTKPILVLNDPSSKQDCGFGSDVAISHDWVAVGQEWFSYESKAPGKVYVYHLTSKTPKTPALTIDDPNPIPGVLFGRKLAMSGSRLVVSSSNRLDLFQRQAGSVGTVYLFELAAANLSRPSRVFSPLKSEVTPAYPHEYPPPAGLHEAFWPVALEGSLLVVGVPVEDYTGSITETVYVYDISKPDPSDPLFEFINPWPKSCNGFGSGVAICGNSVVVSAPRMQSPGSNFSVAYVYDLHGDSPSRPAALLTNPAPSQIDQFGSLAAAGTLLVVGDPCLEHERGEFVDVGRAFVFNLANEKRTVPTSILITPATDSLEPALAPELPAANAFFERLQNARNPGQH